VTENTRSSIVNSRRSTVSIGREKNSPHSQ